MIMTDLHPQPLPPKEVVAELIKRNAVDFEVIGSALAKFGPSMALSGDPDEGFCATGPHYIRLFRLGPPRINQGLPAELQGLAGELTE
jgi:hypothetical protein